MSCEPMIEVPIDQPWEFEYDLLRKDTATGNLEVATGETMTAHFAATAGGAALGSSSTSLSERSTTLGSYYGILAAATLTTALTDYVGSTVWEVYLVSGAPVESREVRVIATRES